MKQQAYHMTLLLDFYGEMLTPRQREFFDLYYNEDLSLAEIAAHYGITRQGVRDVIVRAEAVLTGLEEKTGIIRRFHTVRAQSAAMEETLQALQAYNTNALKNSTVSQLCQTMAEQLEEMRLA